MSSKITGQNIETILAFVTLFTDKDAKLYDIQTEPLSLTPYCYSKEFNRFITSVAQENFVIKKGRGQEAEGRREF
jgi:O-acetyl-ADP-ribose deacetylase